MRVIITGPGRGGTNWVTEIVRASEKFKFTKAVEDRTLFEKKRPLPDKYGTKLATENVGFNEENIDKLMRFWDDMRLIFVFRHPIANCMAKIYRGQPSSRGGDGADKFAGDATAPTAIKAVKHAYDMYVFTKKRYPDRVTFIKLEDLILNNKSTVDYICQFLSIPPINAMYSAYKNNRNTYQKERYGDDIDKSQAFLHENWDSAYDGFFKGKIKQYENISRNVEHIGIALGYNVGVNIIYSSGTLGDAFIQVCKLYNKSKNEKLLFRHFTVHKDVLSGIENVIELLPNTEIEFLDERPDGLIINGDFTNVSTEESEYGFSTNYHPEFDSVMLERFGLPNDYIVIQLAAGAKPSRNREFKKGVYNTIVHSGINVVLLGKDTTKVANRPNVFDLRNKTTIKEVVSIIKGAKEFYGCQGLLSFIALSQKVPTSISLLSPSDRKAVENRVLNSPWKKYYKEKK